MSNPTPPDNFRTIISEFTCDLSVTFPEYAYLWAKWSDPNLTDNEIQDLFTYCLGVFPERFFDILYQSDTLFDKTNETSIAFLPNVDFKLLFHCEAVSEHTKKTIWKYLQLILFAIVGSVKDKSNFGDSMNMFDGIDESDLQEKLSETMAGITEFFKNMEKAPSEAPRDAYTGDAYTGPAPAQTVEPETSEFNMPNMEDFKRSFPFDKMGGMPDIGKLHEHLKTLFDGKIGTLAKEMAEEISEDFTNMLGEDFNNINSTEDAMKKLMKDPKKLMGLMKTVGVKLDAKMKSGEISREEIMKEASEMMGKMKDMGGNNQMNEMFKNLAKNMGKNARVDVAAMDRMTKQEATRARMRNKLDAKRQELAAKQMAESQKMSADNYSIAATGTSNNFVFKLANAEEQEKSYIHPDLLKELELEDKKKTAISSGKKKKNKK